MSSFTQQESSRHGGALGRSRQLLAELFAEAVREVRGDTLVLRHSRLEGDRWLCQTAARSVAWDLPRAGRIIVVGAGKAAAALARGLEAQFGSRIDAGCIVVKYGHAEPLQHIAQIEAGHPVPDENGVAGAAQILSLLHGLRPEDRVFVLLTGGASALLVSPAPGLDLADKQAVTELLLRSDASIEEINVVRKAMSQVKGGRLLDRIAPAQSMTLLISDVPTGDLASVGSGPTLRTTTSDPAPLEILDRHGLLGEVPANVRAHLRHPPASAPDTRSQPPPRAEALLLADNRSIVAALGGAAARLGLMVHHHDLAMTGDTHLAARSFAAALRRRAEGEGPRPCLFVATGETTLQVKGAGLGGRNQEFALVAAQELAGADGVALLASGTDGTDGPTSAAGAFADGSTCERAAAAGFSVAQVLADNDSHTLFRALGDLHVTGPTGTNVMDLVLGLAL